MNFQKKSRILFASLAFVSFSQVNAQKGTGIDLSLMDKSVKPSDDFFNFVNGTWIKNTEIPADKTRWGSFDELRQKTDKDALAILNDAINNPNYKSNTDQGKAINLYKSIMDTVARDKQGIAPLKRYLTKINAVKNSKDLQNLLTEMEPIGGIGFFGAGVGTDSKNSNRNVVNLGLGSLGLPDRDYYVSEDADSKEKRTKYVAHVARMLGFLGIKGDKAKQDAQKILALEIAMSIPRLDRVERRDRRKTYNPMTVAELQKLTPIINWESYLSGIGLPKQDTIIVSQPRYMTALQTILSENKVDDWKAYMRWMLINRAAGQLSSEIGVANFDFYGKTLTGAIKQRPLDERALQTINGATGEALGKLYVEKMFPAEAKTKAENMIKNVIRAYEIRINNLTWMSAETKKRAIEKLNKMTIKVGYPNKWKDYSELQLKSPAEGGSYFDNVISLSNWGFQKD